MLSTASGCHYTMIFFLSSRIAIYAKSHWYSVRVVFCHYYFFYFFLSFLLLALFTLLLYLTPSVFLLNLFLSLSCFKLFFFYFFTFIGSTVNIYLSTYFNRFRKKFKIKRKFVFIYFFFFWCLFIEESIYKQNSWLWPKLGHYLNKHFFL